MPNYKQMNHSLLAALSDIIDIAQAAIEKAEEEILSEDSLSPIIQLVPSDEKNEDD